MIRKLILRLGEPAYHRGFADGKLAKQPNPPRLFRGAYQWGYDWGFMTTNPFYEVPLPFTAADVQKLKDLYRERRAAWDRKYA